MNYVETMLASCMHFSNALLSMHLLEDLTKFASSMKVERGCWHRITLKAENQVVKSDTVFSSTSKLFQLPDEEIVVIFALVGLLLKDSESL